MFNGVDVVQTKHYIKIDCHTYINKFCTKYLDTWMNKVPLTDNRPTPLPSDPNWLRNFNAAVGPDDPKAQAELASSMQLTYHGGVGELIWAMTTCRPDIAYTSVKLLLFRLWTRQQLHSFTSIMPPLHHLRRNQ